MKWKRIKLRFANLVIEFANRDLALKQIEEVAEKGTYPVYVIYGPEGCGKTALFKQAIEILEFHGYCVSMINPLAKNSEERLITSRNLKELVAEIASLLTSAPINKLVSVSIDLLYKAIKLRKSRKIALLADDMFQAIGLDKAEQFIKSLLNIIEYPSVDYEKIVIIASSSEGITRARIGRHNWARLYILWNMSKEGFEKLYNKLPDPKPSFEDVWRLTGGNPRYLSELYMNNWNFESIVHEIAMRGVHRLVKKWGKDIAKAVEDPDYLWNEYPRTEQLINELTELNMIVELWGRNYNYIDVPPPKKALELGIGRYFAWQTPLHKKAVKKALEIQGYRFQQGH